MPRASAFQTIRKLKKGKGPRLTASVSMAVILLGIKLEKIGVGMNWKTFSVIMLAICLSSIADEKISHTSTDRSSRRVEKSVEQSREPGVLPVEYFKNAPKFIADLGNKKGVKYLKTTTSNTICRKGNEKYVLEIYKVMENLDLTKIRNECVQLHFQWYCPNDDMNAAIFCVERSEKQKIEIGLALKCKRLLKDDIAIEKFTALWSSLDCAKKIPILDTLTLTQTKGDDF